jgi:hypothetical protein
MSSFATPDQISISGITSLTANFNNASDGYTGVSAPGTAGLIAGTDGYLGVTSGNTVGYMRALQTDAIGDLRVITGGPGTTDTFGQLVVSSRVPQLSVAFYQNAPTSLALTILTSGSGTTSQGTGTGIFSTGSTASSESKATTTGTIAYSAHYEIFCAVTAMFTAPGASPTGSYQRIGLYNATDGWSFGYNAGTFGLWYRFNSVDTFVSQANWNIDPLSGAAGSKFTFNGSPIALNPLDFNLFRIRGGWLGIAPITFELLSPDGNFVSVHILRLPNNQQTPSVTNPNMPITVDVLNAASSAISLTVTCGCWVAGVTSSASPYSSGSANIVTAKQNLMFPITGHTCATITITGSWTATLLFQYSVDGINFITDYVINTATNTYVSSTTTNGSFKTSFSGAKQYQVITSGSITGTAIIAYSAGLGTSTLLVTAPSLGNVLSTAPTVAELIGGVYNQPPPVPTSGQMVPLQSDASGNMLVSQATIISGENTSINRLMVAPTYNYSYITTSTQIKVGSGLLHSITISAQAATTVLTLADSASAATTPAIYVGTNTVALPVTLIFDCAFALGLYITIGTSTAQVQVSWL